MVVKVVCNKNVESFLYLLVNYQVLKIIYTSRLFTQVGYLPCTYTVEIMHVHVLNEVVVFCKKKMNKMNKMFMLYVHGIALDKGYAYNCTDWIFLC